MAIYIGSQKIKVSGIDKIYVGTQLVYQGLSVSSIALSGQTTSFNYGGTFSFGGTVTATYSDGSTADVTADTVFSGYNMNSTGTQTVTASYTFNGTTVTATYSITVYKVLTKITLSGQTTSLNRGASFSFGGTVTATYNDGTTANVTSSTTFSGYNMSTAGTYTVTASYTYRSVTKTATYSLTVNKAWSQIWSGSKTISNSASTTDITTLSSLSGTVTLRVTWSCSMSGGTGSPTDTYYNNNGTTTTTTKPSSPFQFNLATGSNRNYIVGCRRVNSSPAGRSAYLAWSSSSKKFYLQGAESTYGTASVSLSMTVTKIERYY